MQLHLARLTTIQAAVLHLALLMATPSMIPYLRGVGNVPPSGIYMAYVKPGNVI